MSEENKVQEQAAEAPTLEPVNLSISDLQMLAGVVEVATQRGTFKAGELAQVGTCYNKLTAFLEYVKAQAETEKTPEQKDQ